MQPIQSRATCSGNCSDLWGSTGHQASYRGAAKHGICFASRLVPSNVNSYLFRCHSDGCDLKDQDGVEKHCDDQHYVNPEGRLLRIVGLLPRCSEEWKTEYKKRPVIERYFSSDKHSRLMDQHRYFNIFQMSLHVAMSMLTYLATALAHLQADDYAHMRHMRIKLPKARRREPEQSPEPTCRDPGCACCGRWRYAA